MKNKSTVLRFLGKAEQQIKAIREMYNSVPSLSERSKKNPLIEQTNQRINEQRR
jgi:hypothetical protein